MNLGKRQFHALMALPAVIVSAAVGGCGGGKHARTQAAATGTVVAPSTVEECLKRAGYRTKAGGTWRGSRHASLPAKLTLFALATGGAVRWRGTRPEFTALAVVGPKRRPGEATIIFWNTPADAREAASKAARYGPEIRKLGQLPPQITWRDSASWAVWTGGVPLSEQIARCLP